MKRLHFYEALIFMPIAALTYKGATQRMPDRVTRAHRTSIPQTARIGTFQHMTTVSKRGAVKTQLQQVLPNAYSSGDMLHMLPRLA